MATPGEQLSKELAVRGWTLDNLADAAWLPADLLKQILVDALPVTDDVAVALRDALGVSITL